jgi:hypothetical protein
MVSLYLLLILSSASNIPRKTYNTHTQGAIPPPHQKALLRSKMYLFIYNSMSRTQQTPAWKKAAVKGKLETKNKELAFTFQPTEANHLSHLSALLKEHGYRKHMSFKKQHGFGIKIGIGGKKVYV